MDRLGRLGNSSLRKYRQRVAALGAGFGLSHGSRGFRRTWGYLPLCRSGVLSGELSVTLTLKAAGTARAIGKVPFDLPLQSCHVACHRTLLHKSSQLGQGISPLFERIHAYRVRLLYHLRFDTLSHIYRKNTCGDHYGHSRLEFMRQYLRASAGVLGCALCHVGYRHCRMLRFSSQAKEIENAD